MLYKELWTEVFVFFCLFATSSSSPSSPPHLGICLCVLHMQVYGCVRMLVHGCLGLRSSYRCLPQLLSIHGSRMSRWIWSLRIPAKQCPENPLLRLASQPPHLPNTYHSSGHPNCLMLVWQVLFPTVPSPQVTEAPHFVTMFQ